VKKAKEGGRRCRFIGISDLEKHGTRDGSVMPKTAKVSRVTWEDLEEWVRESVMPRTAKVQEFLQGVLEESVMPRTAEVTEFLGRRKSERRRAVDGSPGYRNGYGKRRHLTLRCGTVAVRRPRVRGLSVMPRTAEERFISRVLPLFARRTQSEMPKTAEVAGLVSDLYLHGLAEGDFDLALRGLLGESEMPETAEAPLSASTVGRLKERWSRRWRETHGAGADWMTSRWSISGR